MADTANELNPVNVTKYQTAADIAQKALTAVIEACVDGAKVIDLCMLGDQTITTLAGGLYNKGKSKVEKKGVAFPTCVSPQNYICHLSPIVDDEKSDLVLSTGDLVRITLGAHIDGYVAQVGHTLKVGGEVPTGREADVLTAGHTACEAAIRKMKAGNTTKDVIDIVNKVVADFGVSTVEGMGSNQMLQHQIEAEKCAVFEGKKNDKEDSDTSNESKSETYTFETGEVYVVDMILSTGAGKVKPSDVRTTVYKRDPSVTYSLKLKASRQLYSEVTSKFGDMAFSMNNFAEPKKGRFSITEMEKHRLLQPYPVLMEKESSASVCSFVFTVLLMENGPLKITSYPWNGDIESEKKPSQEVEELLKTSVRPKKKKTSKK